MWASFLLWLKMKRLIIATALAALMASPSYGQNTKAKPQQTLLLYPQGQEVDMGIVENGSAVTLGPGESNCIEGEEGCDEWGSLNQITAPRIKLYFPKKGNGQMVVCCPGGGYTHVSSWNEGAYVAEWMVGQGIAVCVVEYRLPNKHWSVPLTDVQNAFRYCRAHAEQWGIDQIGVIGFSAGGHLAACASNLYVDDITRPDFSVLVYPVILMEEGLTHKGTHDHLIGKASEWADKTLSVNEYEAKVAKYDELMDRYSLDKQVSGNTPPTFLVHCSDDRTVPIENSLTYFEALRTNKVPTEFQIYPTGGHGWGFTTSQFGSDRLEPWRSTFFKALSDWLEKVHE